MKELGNGYLSFNYVKGECVEGIQAIGGDGSTWLDPDLGFRAVTIFYDHPGRYGCAGVSHIKNATFL